MSYATGRRRFLSLPAVQPGGEVSPAALAHSLASLADEILALRDATFPVHRRSAREAIRQVSAIREFLADVAPASLHRGGAAVALSELHIALQKLGNLLRDCARPGARLWVLMHSEQVSNDFRALIKSVSTALDVLPLSATDASPEVKELVRLVAEQGWKAEVGTAPADSLTARDVGSAIVHFENGIAPNPIDLERIMEQLRIRSWSDCNEEILFLEDLSSSSADVDVGEQKEAALVSSLTALMVYCRVTLFDAGDDGKSGGAKQQEATPPPRAMNQVMNLDDLRCPISYELMLDPVTIATGHTYDRASISKWFRSGSLTCPVTGEKLTDATFVPNSAVRYFVEQLYRSNSLPFPEPTSRQRNSSKSAATPPDSVAAAEATKMVAAFLVSKLASSARREQRKAASEIRKLTKSNVFNRACMVNAGAVPWLLHLLSSREASTQDDAVAALLNLSKHPSGGRAIVDAGGLGVVVDVIRVALKVESQQNAAAILFYLSSVEDCPAEIGNMPDAIPTLVELVREGTYRGKKNAVVTLFGLLLCHSNRAKMLEAGAVPALIALLPSQQRGDLASDAVAVLAKISEQPDGAAAIVGCAAGIPRLVEFFRSTGSRSGRENCTSALLSLCVHGGAEVVSSLSQMPALMPALYSLATEGSPRAGKKARSLIDRIQRLDEQGWPAMAASSVQIQ
ncbi:U-box domain-containing protein 19-like [Curcuma longa]|uniref:U-box domain-containing protein 19-like n=1 Tax=Curcuma longa TaxID=136217 RepID=UPI003D9F1370